MASCSGSNIWDNRISKFMDEECLLLQDEHIVVFCVFTFRVDWNVFFLENEKYVCPGEDEQFVALSR